MLTDLCGRPDTKQGQPSLRGPQGDLILNTTKRRTLTKCSDWLKLPRALWGWAGESPPGRPKLFQGMARKWLQLASELGVAWGSSLSSPPQSDLAWDPPCTGTPPCGPQALGCASRNNLLAHVRWLEGLASRAFQRLMSQGWPAGGSLWAP